MLFRLQHLVGRAAAAVAVADGKQGFVQQGFLVEAAVQGLDRVRAEFAVVVQPLQVGGDGGAVDALQRNSEYGKRLSSLLMSFDV